MTFRIEADNNITAFPSPQQVKGGGVEGETFSNAHELAALAEKWPAPRLLEIWSSLPGIEPVKRFASRQVATARIWKAVQSLTPAAGPTQMKHAARKKPSGGSKGAPSASKTNGKSKTARIIALLRRPQGATLRAIMRETGWQTHSVRGFISGQLRMKLGLKVHSAEREGERVYSIKN
jgi:hypothetical protein